MRRWIAAVVSALLLAASSCMAEESAARTTLFAMNTVMTFTAYGEGADEALDAVAQRIRALETLWSATDADSEIYAANHSGGAAVQVSAETAQLVSFALEMAEQTGGALDPTIYPVLTAWGFTTDSRQLPSLEEIQALLPQVDYRRIRVEGQRLTVPDGMQLDLGAVGKGYAGDLAAQVLREHGVDSAILSLGGNIQAVGSRPDGGKWRVGVSAPWEEGILGVLEISDVAVVTSGGYENYFESEDGHIYWHILDPDTGYPADNGLAATVIVGNDGKLCDALSTALFVMGAQQAEAYWREHSGFEMLLITEEHEILLTEGLAGSFTLGEGRMETVQVISR